MKKLFCLLLVLLSVPAMAAEKKQPEIDAAACRMMVQHVPDTDVEYKPGVDVSGKPVVEADVTPSVLTVPDKIEFDINIDVAQYAGIAVPAGYEGNAKIGTVTVEKGRLFFNGKPMEGDAEASLRELCAPKPALQKSEKIIYNQ